VDDISSNSDLWSPLQKKRGKALSFILQQVAKAASLAPPRVNSLCFYKKV
jgi:hypothetical protein